MLENNVANRGQYNQRGMPEKNNPRRQIKLKIPYGSIIKIIEWAVDSFNENQLSDDSDLQTVKMTFEKLDQNP